MGFEPMTSSLPRTRSTTELQQHKAKRNRAGEGNRTLTTSLEGWSSAIELHPLEISRLSACCHHWRPNKITNRADYPMTTGRIFPNPVLFPVSVQIASYTTTCAQQRRLANGNQDEKKWGEQDSNLRRQSQQIYSLSRLTASVPPQLFSKPLDATAEPAEGFEPTTCCLQNSCSNQLSYAGNVGSGKYIQNLSPRNTK